jgi:F420-dependent oxidoreductase-like protein
MNIGMHTGQQDCSYEDLRRVWRLADSAGFKWVSVWDHFYESPYTDGSSPVFETVSIMAALAAETRNVRVGCLVYSAGYRPPGLLAKAATTIDHISNGRCTLGLGAGWHAQEYKAYGYQFPEPKTRLDMLEECVQIVQSMLTKESTTFHGKHFEVENARCLPPPVKAKLPVFVGGQGEKRTLRIAARWADGWNAAYISPEAFKHKTDVLDQWCEREKRDPAAIERSINVGFYVGADERSAKRIREQFRQAWGSAADRIAGGMLLGTPKEAIEQVGRFQKTGGAKNLNIALRPPYDWDALQAFAEQVIPAFR